MRTVNIQTQCASVTVGMPKVPPQFHVGKLIARRFDGQLFSGYVTLYYPADGEQSTDLWHIEYEDGDEEDLNYVEVRRGVQLGKTSCLFELGCCR